MTYMTNPTTATTADGQAVETYQMENGLWAATIDGSTEVRNRKTAEDALGSAVNLAEAQAEYARRVPALIPLAAALEDHPFDQTFDPATGQVGDVVSGFSRGKVRVGRVTKIGRKNVTIEFVTPGGVEDAAARGHLPAITTKAIPFEDARTEGPAQEETPEVEEPASADTPATETPEVEVEVEDVEVEIPAEVTDLLDRLLSTEKKAWTEEYVRAFFAGEDTPEAADRPWGEKALRRIETTLRKAGCNV